MNSSEINLLRQQTIDRDHFWISDPMVLLTGDGIIPSRNMTHNQQLNALTRLLIIIILLVIFIRKLRIIAYIAIILIILIVILQKFYNDETFTNENYPYTHLGNNFVDYDNSSFWKNTERDNNTLNRKKIDDAINSVINDNKLNKDNSEIVMTDPINNQSDNLNSWNNTGKEDLLFLNTDELFEKKNSERQFGTVVLQDPGDQKSFANFLYRTPPTCKQNTERCLYYEDIKNRTLI